MAANIHFELILYLYFYLLLYMYKFGSLYFWAHTNYNDQCSTIHEVFLPSHGRGIIFPWRGWNQPLYVHSAYSTNFWEPLLATNFISFPSHKYTVSSVGITYILAVWKPIFPFKNRIWMFKLLNSATESIVRLLLRQVIYCCPYIFNVCSGAKPSLKSPHIT